MNRQSFWDCWNTEPKICSKRCKLISDRREADYTLNNNGDSKKLIVNSVIYLSAFDLQQRIMISYGLAQDLFLQKMSAELNVFLDDFKTISTTIIKKGYSNLPRKQCYIIIGKVFVLMNNITFKKGILDTPRYNFYKEHQNDYNSIRHYHNITPRAEEIINNSRLILDFYHILVSESWEDTDLSRNMQLLLLVILFSIVHFYWNVVVMK